VIWRDRLDPAVRRRHKRDLAVAGDEERHKRHHKRSRRRELEQRRDPDPGHPQLAPGIRAKPRKQRQREGAEERAQAHRTEEKTEALRPDPQHLVGEKGQQCGAVHRKKREDRDRDEQHPDHRLAACVRGALRESCP